MLTLLLLALPCGALAWGPQAHAYLGREGARLAGWGEKDQELVSSGALLADLDHTLQKPGVVGDSAGFAQALVSVRGRSAESDRWAAGWAAHCLAQDPGQGEISDSTLKLYADFILGRTAGQQIGSVAFDPERIRKAAILLGATAPSAQETARAVEQLALLGAVEGAILDLMPLELAAREPTFADRVRERVPDWEFLPDRWTHPGQGLPTARSMMPAALAHYEQRLAGSLERTRRLLEAPPVQDAPAVRPGSVPSRAHPMGKVGMPPARTMGISLVTRPAAGGMMRTSVTISSNLLFRSAAVLMLEKLGKDLFPQVVLRWDATSRMGERVPALRQYLRESASRLERLLPQKPSAGQK
ncbi:MAG: hypothetical protein HY816_08335 [Candidatus Wallbacteria bacterium]|nr:hypothetical protein [Candidatus Wallbacteria bacterium]